MINRFIGLKYFHFIGIEGDGSWGLLSAFFLILFLSGILTQSATLYHITQTTHDLLLNSTFFKSSHIAFWKLSVGICLTIGLLTHTRPHLPTPVLITPTLPPTHLPTHTTSTNITLPPPPVHHHHYQTLSISTILRPWFKSFDVTWQQAKFTEQLNWSHL